MITRDKARELYEAGMSVVQIVEKLNLGERTVRRWKSQEKWARDEGALVRSQPDLVIPAGFDQADYTRNDGCDRGSSLRITGLKGTDVEVSIITDKYGNYEGFELKVLHDKNLELTI